MLSSNDNKALTNNLYEVKNILRGKFWWNFQK